MAGEGHSTKGCLLWDLETWALALHAETWETPGEAQREPRRTPTVGREPAASAPACGVTPPPPPTPCWSAVLSPVLGRPQAGAAAGETQHFPGWGRGAGRSRGHWPLIRHNGEGASVSSPAKGDFVHSSLPRPQGHDLFSLPGVGLSTAGSWPAPHLARPGLAPAPTSAPPLWPAAAQRGWEAGGHPPRTPAAWPEPRAPPQSS